MKRYLIFAICFGLTLSLFTVSAIAEDPTAQLCENAINLMKETWRNEIFTEDSDGYFEVAHTRVIHLYTNSDDDRTKAYLQEYFTNEDHSPMTAYVECTLYTDYFNSAPYYTDVMRNHCVAFYEDGTSVCLTKSPIEIFRALTFETKYNSIIKEIVDLDGDYNEVCYLK